MAPYTIVLTMHCTYEQATPGHDFHEAIEKARKFSKRENTFEELQDPEERVYDLPLVVKFPSLDSYERHESTEFDELYEALNGVISELYGKNFELVEWHYDDNTIISDDVWALPITPDTPIHYEVPSSKRSSPEPDALDQPLKKQCV